MTYFHVRITPKAEPSRPEVELDISQEQLVQRFVRPYKMGQPIVITGRIVSSEEIGRIQLNETAEDSTSLNVRMLQQPGARHIFPLLDKHGRLPPEMLADNGRDVTPQYINGAPGHAREVATPGAPEHRPAADAREVFVVHGRNLAARDAMFEFLRSLDLHPLEWSENVNATGKPSPYIGEVLDVAFSRAHAVIVLFTADDEARLRERFQADNDPSYETQLTGQARPNVLFEAGMAMARSENRTILVELGNLRPFSDIYGRYTIRLDNSSQRRQEFAQRLQAARCPTKLTGTAWHTAGDFEAAIVPPVQESASATAQQSAIPGPPQLSEEAQELLVEATRDNRNPGMILMTKTMGGLSIQTNGKGFVERGDGRSEARGKQALSDLLGQELVENSNGTGTVFMVTHKGYQLADALTSS